MKEDLFPKIKFAKLSGDLDFSNNPMSICRFMAQRMNVSDADVENWWETSKETVHTKLKVNRNNVIKAIKTRFQGKKEMPPESAMLLNFTNMTVFSSTTDNILKETQREFHLPSIMGMRRIASRAAYIELFDCLARSVVGRKVYVENRMTKPLSEWFTLTDEAFLLLSRVVCRKVEWGMDAETTSPGSTSSAAATTRRRRNTR